MAITGFLYFCRYQNYRAGGKSRGYKWISGTALRGREWRDVFNHVPGSAAPLPPWMSPWDAPATNKELPCLLYWEIMGKTDAWSEAFTLLGWFG